MIHSPTHNLLKEKEKFEAFFQYATMGILVSNSDSKILLANNFLLSLFGYTDLSELVGEKIDKLIPPRFHSRHHRYVSHYNKNPERRVMGQGKDLFALRKDGSEFAVEISMSNYIANEGIFTISFIIDITARKENEKALTQQKELLALTNLKIEELNNNLEKKVELRTQQLQETLGQLQNSKEELTKALSKEKDLSDLKSRFVSMASHEFRTPLSTILSSASLVAKYTESSQQDIRDKHIQRIKNSVNNLTDLLNEFLSIGKIEDGKITAHPVQFNLKEMLLAICTEMQNLVKNGQKILYRHQGLLNVYLDSVLLKNILLNLLSNAIKFSPENSIINITSSVKNNEIVIVVKDSGMGISKQDQEHLFERFFRGANAANIQGTGLGLHIVTKYIELMDGQIGCTSELEKGTEFVIKLPYIKP